MTPKVALQFIKQSRVKNSKSCIANSMIKTRHKTQVGGGKNSEETQVGGGKNSSTTGIRGEPTVGGHYSEKATCVLRREFNVVRVSLSVQLRALTPTVLRALAPRVLRALAPMVLRALAPTVLRALAPTVLRREVGTVKTS